MSKKRKEKEEKEEKIGKKLLKKMEKVKTIIKEGKISYKIPSGTKRNIWLGENKFFRGMVKDEFI